MTLLTIIWNIEPELIKIGPLAPRYYGLLFALGFVIGYKIMTWIYKKENLDPLKVDTLTMWMVIATVVGARLGHCLFYEPEEYLPQPWRILFIWEGGLASHGATVAILGAMFFYGRKYKDQPMLWILDRLVITIALAGCFIRMGNFFNSEILGKPTDSPMGVVFARPVTDNINRLNDYLVDNGYSKAGAIKNVSYSFTGNTEKDSLLNKEVLIKVDFEGVHNKEVLHDFMSNLPNTIRGIDQEMDHIDHIKLGVVNEPLLVAGDGITSVTFKALAMPRHPSQIYEAFSCILLFVLLLSIYQYCGNKTPRGLLLGIFMVVCFGLRFLWEFLKENQVAFEDNLTLNMGQSLSIPVIIVGLFLIVRSLKYRSNPEAAEIRI